MPFRDYQITSPYGYRTDPFTGQRSFHDGIDLVKGHRSPIEAFVGGKVLYAGTGVSGTGVGGYGNVVVIQDKNRRAHVYAHLDSVSVKKGQTVQRGTIIGRQGATGTRVTGSHLHYEVRRKSSPSLGWVNDPQARTFNPTKYVTNYFPVEQVDGGNVYVVKAGDTLSKIALAHKTTVDALVKLNNIKDKNKIVVGQRIKLSGQTLYLPKTASSWRVYPTNVAPVKGNEKGFLNPKKFGGLQYTVLAKPQANVVTIQTSDFGKVNIYVHPSTGAVIK
ncbi:peptidoglycan DD-metalloendopeptidase family protein [Ornithinibacillus scapharcae]|uniref:peptidoglycan DD-metalloendopeptidase family protein n=1 Tax=Ornithinibacillus scapharcae TaxID=1147159 RepID=UPI000225BF69|nr:peptidoglycan DD-metalloendopeptidase family protein [Ornithinibacillus scapharcae]